MIAGAAIGGVLALTITCAWMLGGDDPAPTVGAKQEDRAWYEELWPVGDEPAAIDGAALAAIDDAIVASRIEDAEGLLAPLEQEHPEHPQLAWRRGRMLAKDPARRHDALVTYGTAAQADPALLDDPAFVVELDRLLREPKLQTTAVKVAIERLGHPGHAFLLERLNDLETPLPWAERKQAAEAVMAHAECAPLLDAHMQIAQDLLQASEADDPCAVLEGALMKMKLDLHEVYVQPAHDAKLPKSCKQHKALLAEVREALAAKHGAPKPAKSSGRCRGVRCLFRSGC